MEWEEDQHESYGMVGASRVSGKIHLFGSDFEHHNFVQITIQHASMMRTVSRDWPAARKELICVYLSEAQWASFVSAMNVGDGVPCTLGRVNGQTMPEIPIPASKVVTFQKEFLTTINEILKRIETLEQSNVPARVKHELGVIKNHLRSNVPYVAKTFTEHIEHTIEKAKIEVTAYVQSVLTKTGIKALKGKPPITLPEGGSDDAAD